MLGIETVSGLLREVGAVDGKCTRDRFATVMVPKAELVAVGVARRGLSDESCDGRAAHVATLDQLHVFLLAEAGQEAKKILVFVA